LFLSLPNRSYMWHLCAPPPSDSTVGFLVEVITAWILLRTDCHRRCRVLLLLESPLASAFFLSDRHRRVRLLQAPPSPGQASPSTAAARSRLCRRRCSVRIGSWLWSGFLASARSVFDRLGSHHQLRLSSRLYLRLGSRLHPRLGSPPLASFSQLWFTIPSWSILICKKRGLLISVGLFFRTLTLSLLATNRQ
jgi:hypothetical protein